MLKSQPSQKNIKGSFEVDKIFSVQCNATRRLIHCLQHMQEMEVSDDASTTLRSGPHLGIHQVRAVELVSIIVAAIVATVAAAGAVVAPAGIRRHILPRTVTVSTGRHVISLAVPAIAIVGGDGDLR